MIWWLTKPERLNDEKNAVSMLQESCDWLQNVKWQILPDFVVTADFDILHGKDTFHFTLKYPEYFPDTCPAVISKNDERVSFHQYGVKDGELCLEFRSDNWSSDITGAMMIESSYRLISGERHEAGGGEVPSAHEENVGVRLRGGKFRFLLPNNLLEKLREIPVGTYQSAILSERHLLKTFVARLKSLGAEDAEGFWSDTSVFGGDRLECDLVTVAEQAELVPAEVHALADFLLDRGYTDISNKIHAGNDSFTMLVNSSDTPKLAYIYTHEGARTIIWYRTAKIQDALRRIDVRYDVLACKQLGIIGCGSIGSKMAISLARAGVGKFILVDDDILKPGNIVRNELDAIYVGQHKTLSVRHRIHQINPDCDVKTREIALGGQVASSSTESLLQQLGECDVIIDATANPDAFNLAAITAKTNRKPLFWTEVFAGGIGGLIARSVPDIDPHPIAARNQIHGWCKEKGVSWVGNASDYGAQVGGQTLIADDGDVSHIASSLVRFVLDTLTNSANTIFPCAAYFIGMSRGWIFSQPFETFPIQLTFVDWAENEKPPQKVSEEAMEFILSILPQDKNVEA